MLKKRETLLIELTQLSESMAAQIKYRALALGDLFEALSGGGGEFINAVLENKTRGNLNWREAWNKAAGDFSELKEEREILTTVGNSLGGSDIAGQIAMLELNKELLLARLSDAREASVKKGSMYRSIGLLAGLGLAIIII